jgi:hypothetical protein
LSVAGGRVVQVGGWRVTALRDGTFALDGGAMFGVVPRPVWEKLTPQQAQQFTPEHVQED